MRALVQRVTAASVAVDGTVVGAVGRGLCALVGVTHTDTEHEARWIADKLANLRLFPLDGDDEGMERSVLEVGGGVLVVSQFTLYGDARKGRRPTWIDAARPEHAEPLVEAVVARLQAQGVTTATGTFRTHMQVEIHNDGPVTVLVER